MTSIQDQVVVRPHHAWAQYTSSACGRALASSSASNMRWMWSLLNEPAATPNSSGSAVTGPQRSAESFEPGATQRCVTRANTTSAEETS